MPIKVDFSKKHRPPTWQYPAIGRLRDTCSTVPGQMLVVLFAGSGIGTVLATQSSGHCVGHYTRDWDMARFQPLEGSISLGNED